MCALHGGGPVVVAAARRGRRRCRTLAQPAGEVRDRGVELVGVHDRGEEGDRAGVGADGVEDGARHAEEHLDLERVGHPTTVGEHAGGCEQDGVESGERDPDGVGVLRRERGVEQAQECGVDLLAGGEEGRGAGVHEGVGAFLGQVGAVDEPDPDGCAAAEPSRGRPVGQGRQDAEAVRQRRGQRDAGGRVGELVRIEQRPEHRDAQVEVVRAVDEQRDGAAPGDGCAEHRDESVDRLRGGVLERPRRRGRDDVRDREGHRGHVVASDQVGDPRQSTVALGGTEHGRAEGQDVEAGARAGELAERGAESGLRGVDHQVSGESAEHPPRGRDDRPRRHRREAPTDGDGSAEVPGEEVRHGTAGLLEVAGGDLRVVGSDHLVDEPAGEVEAALVTQDLGEPGRSGVGLHPAGGVQPASDEGRCVVGAVLEACGRHGLDRRPLPRRLLGGGRVPSRSQPNG